MEFSEVVNPHFAFPVVGVVLCAFLVFAFGFKSPVQPPSFDFESADEGRKRKPKPKKKPQSNGNVPSAEEAKSSVSKSNAATKTASPKAASSTEKSPKPQKEAKPKVKKTANKVANVAKEAKLDAQESGGWETVGLSKKKKNKSKKESEEPTQVPEQREAVKETEEPAAVPVPEPAPVDPVVVEEAAQPQRIKKDRASKTKTKEVANVATVDLSDKENTPDPANQQPATNQYTKVVPKDKKSKTQDPPIEKITNRQLQNSPSKNAPAPLAPSSQSAVSSPDSGASAPVQPSAAKSKTPTPAPDTPTPATDSKSSKSPKKKKEKQKKEEVAAPAQKGSQEASRSPASEGATSQTQSMVSDAQVKAAPAVPAVLGDANVTDPASSPPEGAGDAQSAATSSNVTFDELGDWQEAKPVKKRKTKARRDN